MEMDIRKLEINSLPVTEKILIAHLQRMFPTGYLFGFSAEENTNILAQSRFSHLNTISNVALLRAGSGGRMDGAGVGDQDFILLTSKERPEGSHTVHHHINAEEINDLIAKIENVDDFGMQKNTHCTVEHKRVCAGQESLLYHPSNNKPFPDRILESVFIAGNQALFECAKKNVLHAIHGNKKLLKRIKEELRTYRRTTHSGETLFRGKTTPQFIEALNLIMYDPELKIHGLKYGPLRYFQLALAVEFYSALANQKVSPEFFYDLPSAFEDRVRYIFRKEICNPEYQYNLINLTLVYIKAASIQATLKLNFHNSEHDRSEPNYVHVTKNTIPTLRAAVDKFPHGKILAL
ncbi:hypothetical protein ACSLBF_15555 [Pseudoalteromonas sp. T1lg65]|uniref:hypothetical protein n=1 Tax=Pseudoalteromonas sp. T1lg65 TaxID=2077101 RepID=UPI003F78C6A0